MFGARQQAQWQPGCLDHQHPPSVMHYAEPPERHGSPPPARDEGSPSGGAGGLCPALENAGPGNAPFAVLYVRREGLGGPSRMTRLARSGTASHPATPKHHLLVGRATNQRRNE